MNSVRTAKSTIIIIGHAFRDASATARHQTAIEGDSANRPGHNYEEITKEKKYVSFLWRSCYGQDLESNGFDRQL